MTHLSQHSLNQELIDLADYEDNPAAVAALLVQGADPKAQRSHALLRAALQGHLETLRILIPLSDTRLGFSECLRMASRNGHAECVKLLIPVSNPKDMNSGALLLASRNGYVECVALLMPISTPLFDNPQALNQAIAHGKAEILSIMLAHDPRLLALISRDDGLATLRDLAISREHFPLASLLGSLIEQAVLDEKTPLPKPASRGSVSRL